MCSPPDGRTAAEVDVDLLEFTWTGAGIRLDLDWLGLNRPTGDPGFLQPKPEILDPQETSGCVGVRRCNNWVITGGGLYAGLDEASLSRVGLSPLSLSRGCFRRSDGLPDIRLRSVSLLLFSALCVKPRVLIGSRCCAV